MITDEFRTILEPSQGLYKDRGSKFLSFAYPISNEETVKELLHQVKKTHYECNHHCYAFRLNPGGKVYRSSDDMEPSGSAGKPILGQLLAHELTDILVIVARYFGGSLLGVPGLINAYRSAAYDAIQNASIVVKTINESFEITVQYEHLNVLMSILKNESVHIIKQEFGDPAYFQIAVRKSKKNELIEKLTNNHRLSSYLQIK